MVAGETRDGFTIAEVLVAFVLLALAASAVAGAATTTAASVQRQVRTEGSIQAATWLVDSLAATGASGAGSIDIDAGRVAWTSDAGWVHARLLDPRGRVVSVLWAALETPLPTAPGFP